jgi:hypothetical protein
MLLHMQPKAIHDRMLTLENQHGADHASLGVVAARLLGVDHDETFDATLSAQVSRTELLCADWYTRRVALLPNSNAMAAAMVQGITFAVAVLEHEGRLTAV